MLDKNTLVEDGPHVEWRVLDEETFKKRRMVARAQVRNHKSSLDQSTDQWSNHRLQTQATIEPENEWKEEKKPQLYKYTSIDVENCANTLL